MNVPNRSNRQSLFHLCAILFVISIGINTFAAIGEKVPGYMDAEYYYTGAIRLAKGYGFTEMILWNYLDEPLSLPHASHTYWMPLPSMIATGGMLLTGNADYLSARIGFILLASLISPLTAILAAYFYQGKRQAILAGILALFPGFYTAYLSGTETFTPYMLFGLCFFLGSIYLLKGGHSSRSVAVIYFLLGLVAGLQHLTRADGIVWLPATMILAFLIPDTAIKDTRKRTWERVKNTICWSVLICAGYAAVMTPWYLRNIDLYGGLFPRGGIRTLYLTSYEQTFSFPASSITLLNWWNSGFDAILSARWLALLANLKTVIGVSGSIFLFPLMLVGGIRLRNHFTVKFGFYLWLCVFTLMTMIFPFAGSRGGFFHSGAAFQGILWALVPAGLEGFIKLGSKLRHWSPDKAFIGLSSILAILAVLFSSYIYSRLVFGSNPKSPVWEESQRIYEKAEQFIRSSDSAPNDIVLVNNPPSYFLASSGRGAISIPDGDETNLKAAAIQFNARFLIIDQNTVPGLKNLYEDPVSSEWLDFLGSLDTMRFYRINLK